MSAHSPARKKALLGLSSLFVLAALGAAGWWYLHQGSETTDDAYVAGNVVPVSSRVAGNVLSLHGEETQQVAAGSLLVALDETDAKLALLRAQTQLAQTVRQLSQQQRQLGQLAATVGLRQAELDRAQGDQARREVLGQSNAVGREEVLHARQSVAEAKAAVAVAQAEQAALQAKLLTTPLAQQPEVLYAAEQLREAWLSLQRTRILSPVSGIIAKRNVQVGSHVAVGASLFAVVPMDQLWVDANFKEIQLAEIRVGQPATLTADLYGDEVVYHGSVEGVAAGTGSVFSLLPAQNATGNWLKVVQRLPVRIKLDPAELAKHPLRLGLSMQVTVDVSDTSGTHVTDAPVNSAIASTDVLTQDMAPVDALIAKIIADNSQAS